MKKSLLFSVFASALIFGGCSNIKVSDAVYCVQIDPLKKAFKEEMYFEENTDAVAVAKGENATFQFVFRSVYPVTDLKIEAGSLTKGEQKIDAGLKAFVGYIRAGKHTGNHSKDAVFPVSDYYPDCLNDEEMIDVPPMSNQPVWVSYAIPKDADAGDYTAEIVLTGKTGGKPFRVVKSVKSKVFDVVVPEQTLMVTNWFFGSLSKMNNDDKVEPYSDRYWELMTELAHIMRDHGQNVYLFPGVPSLCDAKLTDGKYAFDFTNFDKTIELFLKEGNMKRIEGGHLGGRSGKWESEFVVSVPGVGARPIENDTARLFLSQFFPALYQHLESKGWADIYMQHIADEPTDQNAASYIKITEFVKKQMPGTKIIDAVMSRKLANTVDIWVPILDHFHHDYDFYRERKAAGDEVWYYTCTGPQGNYANRFLEQPLVQMRILHWLNYRYGATGYLHWGFNSWDLSTTGDLANDNEDWPGGDCWIVYPAYGKVKSSIRLEAMLDGIRDYELLKLLEQKSPDKAKELAASIVKDFDRYQSNIRIFRATRLKLLEACSSDL